jgi:hypothetical protein
MPAGVVHAATTEVAFGEGDLGALMDEFRLTRFCA